MRILIVEDNPLLALDLQDIAEEAGHQVVGPCGSLAASHAEVEAGFDFALLDVDLPDGKSFSLATRLDAKQIPYAFVSASLRTEIPQDLRHAPFFPKPVAPSAIRQALAQAKGV